MNGQKWPLALLAVALALQAMPVAAQDDDDDDGLSGGALAVLLLSVGGAVAESDTELKGKIKSALDSQKVRYTEKQLESLAKQTSAKLGADRGSTEEFTVCAEDGRPCLQVVREAKAVR